MFSQNIRASLSRVFCLSSAYLLYSIWSTKILAGRGRTILISGMSSLDSSTQALSVRSIRLQSVTLRSAIWHWLVYLRTSKKHSLEKIEQVTLKPPILDSFLCRATLVGRSTYYNTETSTEAISSSLNKFKKAVESYWRCR